MRLIGLAGVLALSSLACQRKEESTAAKSAASAQAEPAATSAPATEEKGEAPSSKPTKASERPEVDQKKPPVAEPVADKPGYVKSPYSGAIIDVRGIPAGRLVADPMFPASEKKHFRIPDLGPEQEAIVREEAMKETVRLNGPVAQPVPGKEGFFFSPYDNKLIDAKGIEPGEVIKDPGLPEGQARFFKLPGGLPAEMDDQ